jgi:tetratricopeptide (TPR) repeat protein
VRIDPNHALSWGGVAEASVLSAHYGHIYPRDAIAKARSALEKVNKLSGESAVTIYVEAFIAYIEREWARIDTTYQRATNFQPPHPNTRGTFGIIQAVAGRREEAALLLDEAIAADPLAAFPYAAKGIGQAAMRENVESLDSFEQAFALEPDHLLALWGYCCVKVGLGDFDRGIAAAERALTLAKRSSFFVGLLGWALAEAGRHEEARDLLAELRANGGPTVVTEGWLLAALDEKDEAFEALSRAEEELHPFVCYLGLPSFDKLRGDPRFSDLANRLGVPGYTSSL